MLKEFLAIIFGGFAAAVLMVYAVIYGIAKPSCGIQFPDIETQWSFLGGCQVYSREGWIPAENYRVMP